MPVEESSNVNSQKKIEVSLLRVITLLLVVICHCICIYGIWPDKDFVLFLRETDVNSYAYNPIWHHLANALGRLHMPIFFFISGYLYSYKLEVKKDYIDTKYFVSGKIKRLVIPYLFFRVLSLSTPEMTIACGHLWYLEVLFFFLLITHFLHNQLTSLSWKARIIFLFFTVMMDQIICVNYGMMKFVHYYTYFLLGFVYVKLVSENLIDKLRNRALPLFFSSLVGIYLVSVLHLNLTLLELISTYSTCVFIISLFYFISTKNNWLEKVKLSKFVVSLDENCMGIYLFHHIFILLLLQIPYIYYKMVENVVLSPILLFLIVLIVSYILSLIFSEIKYLRMFVGK